MKGDRGKVRKNQAEKRGYGRRGARAKAALKARSATGLGGAEPGQQGANGAGGQGESAVARGRQGKATGRRRGEAVAHGVAGFTREGLGALAPRHGGGGPTG